jgi:hypothetical protein
MGLETNQQGKELLQMEPLPPGMQETTSRHCGLCWAEEAKTQWFGRGLRTSSLSD